MTTGFESRLRYLPVLSDYAPDTREDNRKRDYLHRVRDSAGS
jgi:hypothetical protein